MVEELISVIIPVYNVAPYLQRCLDSITNNTYRNLEIICIDDGSTDESGKILFAQSDPRIIIISKENGGVSSARNAGIKAARGEFISFVDPDDWVHHQYIELLYSAMSQTVDIVHCRYISTDTNAEEPEIQSLNPGVFQFSDVLTDHDIRTKVWGKLFRRSAIENIWFSESISMAEDKLFCSQVLRREGYIAVLNDILYYYFQRADSAIYSQHVGQNLFPVGKAFLDLGKACKDSFFIEEAYKAFLAHRYINMFEENADEIQETTNSFLSECDELARSIFSLKRRIIYKLMHYCPSIYRAYRILQDLSMLDWERQKKNKKT